MSAQNLPESATPGEDDGPDKIVMTWRPEIERAQKSSEKWRKRVKKIVERYRAEEAGERKRTKARLNILWSNIQTLQPALYARPPKAVAQRTHRDRDPVGRVACRILERVLQYQVDAGGVHETIEQCVLDKLLSGRGSVWLRYEPVIEPQPESEDTGGEGETAEEPPVLEQIADEMLHVDYVHPDDFEHEPARVWADVSWVARRVYMTRAELVDRFGEEVGDKVTLTCGPDQQEDADKRPKEDECSKAEVWEIWNRAKKQVVWIAADFDQVLDQKDDPYHLTKFFPCPRPLYATTTNDTLVPVPDSEQYKPQADELDLLTTRIQRVVDAIKVRGAYNLAFPELARILQGDENDMVPINAWDQFTSGNGLKGAMDFVPIELFIKVLDGLYKAREEVKSEIYEISGLSDILRGQGDASETATGVNAKGRFATLRLKHMQDGVARFVRDIIRLQAELICELFQPETMAEQASCQEMSDLQIQVPMPSPMIGHNGGPPLDMPAQPPVAPQRLPAMAG